MPQANHSVRALLAGLGLATTTLGACSNDHLSVGNPAIQSCPGDEVLVDGFCEADAGNAADAETDGPPTIRDASVDAVSDAQSTPSPDAADDAPATDAAEDAIDSATLDASSDAHGDGA